MIRLELPMHWLSLYGHFAKCNRVPYVPIGGLTPDNEVSRVLTPPYDQYVLSYGATIECGRFFDPDLMADRIAVFACFVCDAQAALFRLTYL